MGRGNVCVYGKYEGLYYIDYDDIDVYRRDEPDAEYPEVRHRSELTYEDVTGNEWLYDDWGSAEELDYAIETFIDSFTKRFASFGRCKSNTWLRCGAYGAFSRRAVLENELFYIAIEDNEWSLAIELLQKEDPYDNHLEGLQKRHFQRYMFGMRDALMEQFESIGTYAGWWTHGIIRRDSFKGS